MDVTVVEDYGVLSAAGADLVAHWIRENPAASIVPATGRTPMGLYGRLVEMQQQEELDTSRLRVFQLDAYLGVRPDDPCSLFGWMKRAFLDPLAIPEDRTIRLPGDTAEPTAACAMYEDAVRAAGGFDIAILGLGPNGHLGFNEPPSDGASPTRVVRLTPESIRSNGAYWGGPDRVSQRALTAGMSLLMAARHILLVVSGAHKRDILHRTVTGPVTPEVPASYLALSSNVKILADREAAVSL